MHFKKLPPTELLWELFDYNPLNGNLYWRVSRSRVKVGDIAGYKGRYQEICINLVRFKLHRIIWKWVKGVDPGQKEVDHRNQDKTDNSWKNLRLGSHSQNGANKKSKKKSGYTGVRKQSGSSRFQAMCKKDGVEHYKYGFKTPEEAALAYNEMAIELFGEFACPNEIPDN